MLQQKTQKTARAGRSPQVGLGAVAVLLLGSGLAALIFQVAWLRELRLVFGTSTSATAAVLGLFMGGLGVGSWLLGPRADRHPRPLRLFSSYLLLIALGGALSPWLCDLVRWVYIALGGQTELGSVGASVVRLGLSAIVLGLPTTLMGGTLPAAVRAATAADDRCRRGMGLLYGANEAGAVLGALASTFFLLEHLGTSATLWLACGLYLATALAARRLAARYGDISRAEEIRIETRSVSEESAQSVDPLLARRGSAGKDSSQTLRASRSASGRALVYATAALVGFAFFVMELVWYRMLGPILGGTTFTFGLILAVVVAGIGLGGALYGVIFGRLEPTFRALAATCALEAAAMAYPLAWGDGLAVMVAVPHPEGVLGLHMPALGWTAIVALVVLPAAVLSGIQFPLLVALLGQGRRAVGKQVGRAFAWNTVGAVCGSLAGGFGLLPWLTAPGAWRAMVCTLAAVAAAALLVSLRRERRSAWLAVPAAAIAAALVMASLPGPTAAWRHSGIGAGRATLTDADANSVRAWLNFNRRATTWEAEGVEASIAIRRDASLSFYVNGKCDGNSLTDASTQVMGGLVGAILQGSPKIGLCPGAGHGRVGRLAGRDPDHGTGRRGGTGTGGDGNGPALRTGESPRVGASQGSRHLQRRAGGTLDRGGAIRCRCFSEPSNPYRAGVASLYTREFYRAARGRMKAGGVFAQFVQAYEVEEATVQTILASLKAAFPCVEVWQTNPTDLLLVGRNEPPRYDADALRERIAREPYRSALRNTWGGCDLEGFLARFVAGPEAVEELLRETAAAPNTDDRNRLEYSFARSVGRQTGFSIETLRQRALASGGSRPAVAGKVDWQRLEEQRQLMYLLAASPCPDRVGMTPAERTRVEVFHQFVLGSGKKMVETYEAAPYAPASAAEAATLALGLVFEGRERDRLQRLLAEVQKELPDEAAILRALQACGKNDGAAAAEGLVEVFQRMRANPWIMTPLGSAAIRAAVRLAMKDPGQALRLRAALAEPFAVEMLHDDRCRAMLAMGELAGPARAVEDLQRFEPNVPWDAEFLRTRAEVYANLHDARAWRAARDLQEFRKNAASAVPKETGAQ